MIMKRELEDYIQNNLDGLDHKKPDPLVLNRILEQLQPASKAAPRGILISFSTMRWAAACIIAIVCGFIVWQKQTAAPPEVVKKMVAPPKEVKQQEIKQQNSDTLAYTGIDAVDDDLAQRKSTLARVIRDKKMVSYAGFSNISSAADRINAVSAAATLKNNRNEVVNGLLEVLSKDPNTNVRLAALDGLARFYRDDYTRKKLLVSLKKQTDPLVQIALIGLLTRMRESGIITELEKMVQDQSTEKTVKDCAYSSMLQLHQ
jgi:hypothetical protein